MSRSGYSDDGDNIGLWRGAVTSAIRGKRGQKFLRDLIAALDALPEKRLISDDLIHEGEVCALGSVGKMRGIDMSKLNPDDHHQLADVFNVAPCMIAEIEFENDDDYNYWSRPTPEQRWSQMRAWAVRNLKEKS